MLLVPDYPGCHNINAIFLPSHQCTRLYGASENSLVFAPGCFLSRRIRVRAIFTIRL